MYRGKNYTSSKSIDKAEGGRPYEIKKKKEGLCKGRIKKRSRIFTMPREGQATAGGSYKTWGMGNWCVSSVTTLAPRGKKKDRATVA